MDLVVDLFVQDVFRKGLLCAPKTLFCNQMSKTEPSIYSHRVGRRLPNSRQPPLIEVCLAFAMFFALGGRLATAAEFALRHGARQEEQKGKNENNSENNSGAAAGEKAGTQQGSGEREKSSAGAAPVLVSARTAARWRTRLTLAESLSRHESLELEKDCVDPVVFGRSGGPGGDLCVAVPLGEVMQLARLLVRFEDPPFDFGQVVRPTKDSESASSDYGGEGVSPIVAESPEQGAVAAGAIARQVSKAKGRRRKQEKPERVTEAEAIRTLISQCESVDDLRDELPGAVASSDVDTTFAQRTKELKLAADARAYGRMVQNVDVGRIETTKGLSRVGREMKNMNHMMAMAFNIVFTCGSVFLAVHFVMKQAGYPDDSPAPILAAIAASIVLLIVETVLYMIRSNVMEERVPNDPDQNRREQGHQLSVLNAEPGSLTAKKTSRTSVREPQSDASTESKKTR
jgi:Endoplasmic reticulum-based factor for assembly of V-ATPase